MTIIENAIRLTVSEYLGAPPYGALWAVGALLLFCGVVILILHAAASSAAPAAPEPRTLSVRAPGRAGAVRIFTSSELGDRANQQDHCTYATAVDEATLQSAGLLGIVCDGMGGLQGGEAASQCCAATVLSQYYLLAAQKEPAEALSDCAREADTLVASLASDNGMPLNAGTTLVAAVIRRGAAYWISVGDSRIYLLHGGQLRQLTRDHNYALTLQKLLSLGHVTREEAETHPKREALISYVGQNPISLIDTDSVAFSPENGDLLILCSDGVTKCLDDRAIEQLALSCPPEQLAKTLTAKALQAGTRKHDNTTAMVIH